MDQRTLAGPGVRAGGWLSGRWRTGGEDLTSRRSVLVPQRYDLSLPPTRPSSRPPTRSAGWRTRPNSLIDMTLAFVIRHPAVTAAIIGARKRSSSSSRSSAPQNVVLDAAVLDRIDEIVAPGTTINPADAGWTNPALDPAARRR
jgi:aryl-alcohol dehydrogenase-like predicted oxidoreductase